jgi:hypothetical protein
MDLKTVQENQRTYWGFAKHRVPSGFTHHMTPGSIHQLLQLLGRGQGFVVYHMLMFGAKKAIGTDWDETILRESIPFDAYRSLVDIEGRIVDFRCEDFLLKRSHVIDSDCSVVTLFIGDNRLVERLLKLFGKKKHLLAIAFMKPSRGFDYDFWIRPKVESREWTVEEFTLVLSGSNERRLSYVIRRGG